jgi:hypothetical protein
MRIRDVILPMVLGLTFSVAAVGCFVRVDDSPRPVGALTVEWSIDGYSDARACAEADADVVDVVVVDAAGDVVLDAVPLCEATSVTLTLDEGGYEVEATLLDDYARPVSSTLGVGQVLVLDDSETVISLDFAGPLAP